MRTDEVRGGSDEERLLEALAEVVRLEAQMPDQVADAAKALFDWVRVDAVLAELATEVSLTRDTATATVWRAGDVQLRVEVEPAGYQRRRLVVVVAPPGYTQGASVQVQLSDGTELTATADVLGDFVAEVPAGAVRVIAPSGQRAVRTAWFTV